MSELRVRKAQLIRAEIKVPGDKSMSHRAVMLGALSNGPCVITGFLPSEDCLCTVEAMRALGIEIEQPEPTTLIVYGNKKRLKAPGSVIDCGNSGTTMRLLAGILAGQPFKSCLTGDDSLKRRPMGRIIDPLTQMGAKIQAQTLEVDGKSRLVPPLDIEGGSLSPISWVSPVPSAQIKSAVLLAGLFASGKTTVQEPAKSRDHTERMLQHFLVRVSSDEKTVSLHGDQIPESRPFKVPGDISSAAFWMVAAAAQPGSHLVITDVGLNNTRTGVNSVLLRMGASIREVVENVDQSEPSGKIEIHGGELHGTTIENTPTNAEIPRLIDEIPVLAVAGALAGGQTVFRDIGELRVKESDRIAAIVENLRAMGVRVEEGVELDDDGREREFLKIHGGLPLRGARIRSFGDHRIAMAFCIAGMFAEGETIITDTDCIKTSYPDFESTLYEVMRPRGMRSYETTVITDVRSLDLNETPRGGFFG